MSLSPGSRGCGGSGSACRLFVCVCAAGVRPPAGAGVTEALRR
uniref:Uncharacterized protein n=1 Tax=Anguilla anguilla TaxID=7936 RepID=A0A0E9VZU3_ANGAN